VAHGQLSQVSPHERATILDLIAKKINSPRTSSCGRLFDGVAALCGLCSENAYEAQAAIALETAAASIERPPKPWEIPSGTSTTREIGIAWLVRTCVERLRSGEAVAYIAADFHASLAELLVDAARDARTHHDTAKVGLSGGVYQNTLFFHYLARRLVEEEFEVFTHARVPTNDGGLALGQVMVADAALRHDNSTTLHP